MEDTLKLRLLAARLRHLAMQIETRTLKDIADFGDIFSLDADQGVNDFLRGELKLRADYEQALMALATAGNKSAMAATSSINKQFNSPAELQAIVDRAAKRKR